MRIAILCILMTVLSVGVSSAQTESQFPELSSLLALFSAQALPTGGVRLNWTLESSSPTVLAFRIYRGYEDVGNFSVLEDIPVHSSGEILSYSFTDAAAVTNVSYYYKLSAVGQSKESVFPVVISATPHGAHPSVAGTDTLPVLILPGAKVSLYVRRGGHVQLDLLGDSRKSLVDDSLRPGIYEFDIPGSTPSATLHVRHESGYESDVAWPVK
jgi:hypothetical protein